MSQEQESCATCRFWGRSENTNGVGWCRYDPPRPFISSYLDQQNIAFDVRMVRATAFPATKQETWCGKWKRKG